jgi:hypothetical protein
MAKRGPKSNAEKAAMKAAQEAKKERAPVNAADGSEFAAADESKTTSGALTTLPEITSVPGSGQSKGTAMLSVPVAEVDLKGYQRGRFVMDRMSGEQRLNLKRIVTALAESGERLKSGHKVMANKPSTAVKWMLENVKFLGDK